MVILIVNISEFLAAKNSLEWVLMVKSLILNVFINIKHHFVKINLQSPSESYQPITFAICPRTGSGWKQFWLTPLAWVWRHVVKQVVSVIPLACITQCYWRVSEFINAPNFHACEKNVNNTIWHSPSGYLPNYHILTLVTQLQGDNIICGHHKLKQNLKSNNWSWQIICSVIMLVLDPGIMCVSTKDAHNLSKTWKFKLIYAFNVVHLNKIC